MEIITPRKCQLNFGRIARTCNVLPDLQTSRPIIETHRSLHPFDMDVPLTLYGWMGGKKIIVHKQGQPTVLDTQALKDIAGSLNTEKLRSAGFKTRERDYSDIFEALAGRLSPYATASKYGELHDTVCEALELLMAQDVRGWNRIKDKHLNPRDFRIDLSGLIFNRSYFGNTPYLRGLAPRFGVVRKNYRATDLGNTILANTRLGYCDFSGSDFTNALMRGLRRNGAIMDDVLYER